MHTRFHVFTLRTLGVLGLLLSGGAFAEEPSLQARLDQVIEKALADKRIVGAVVLVAQDGQVVYHRAAGEMDREAHKPMREDTIFRLASMSKTLVSAAAMALVEQGKLGLDEPITRWLPTFRPTLEGGRPATITVRQLLTHTSGLGYTVNKPEGGPYHQAGASDGLDQPGLGMEENLRRIASVPLAFEPGTQWKYSFAIDVLGAVVARASGETLPKAVERLVTRPLGLSDTGFSVRERARLSIPYADGKPEPVRMGESYAVSYVGAAIRFTPGRVFDARSFPSGGGGMVSTAGVRIWRRGARGSREGPHAAFGGNLAMGGRLWTQLVRGSPASADGRRADQHDLRGDVGSVSKGDRRCGLWERRDEVIRPSWRARA